MVNRSRKRADHRDAAISCTIQRQIVYEERPADLGKSITQLGHDRR
jgi:hypothetical protein